MIDSQPRRSEPSGELVTVDIEQPSTSQLDKWEPPSGDQASGRPDDGRVALQANSVEDDSQGSTATSEDEAEEMVEYMTGEQPETGKPYLAALEALGAQLSVGTEGNSVNIGNSIIKESAGPVHIGPRISNKFLGSIHIDNVTSVTYATEPDKIDKHAEAEASESKSKLSTTSEHPFFPLSQAKVAEWLWTRKCIVSVIAVAVLLTVVIVAAILASGSGENDDHTSSANDSSITTDPVIPGVRIVQRVAWGAQPPRIAPEPLQVIPAPYVIISHTATDFCFMQSQCVMHVRFAQSFHMESFGWNDIAYNFLVGGDGNAYEGRGWDIEGAHTFNYNVKSIGISFIGTFDNVKPTKGQIHAALKLIEFGVENGHISKDYKLLGHRQFTKTESPGQKLYEIIQTWDHWVPQP